MPTAHSNFHASEMGSRSVPLVFRYGSIQCRLALAYLVVIMICMVVVLLDGFPRAWRLVGLGGAGRVGSGDVSIGGLVGIVGYVGGFGDAPPAPAPRPRGLV